MFLRKQICIPYCVGALKNVRNTREWIPERGKNYITGGAVLAPEQMDINHRGIRLCCKVEGSFEVSKERFWHNVSVAVVRPKSFKLSKLILLNSH